MDHGLLIELFWERVRVDLEAGHAPTFAWLHSDAFEFWWTLSCPLLGILPYDPACQSSPDFDRARRLLLDRYWRPRAEAQDTLPVAV